VKKTEPVKWVLTLKRGKFSHKTEGHDPEALLDKCLNAYDQENWPERDRHGGFN